MAQWTFEDDKKLVKYLTQLGEDPLTMLSIDLPSEESIHSSAPDLKR